MRKTRLRLIIQRHLIYPSLPPSLPPFLSHQTGRDQALAALAGGGRPGRAPLLANARLLLLQSKRSPPFAFLLFALENLHLHLLPSSLPPSLTGAPSHRLGAAQRQSLRIPTLDAASPTTFLLHPPSPPLYRASSLGSIGFCPLPGSVAL